MPLEIAVLILSCVVIEQMFFLPLFIGVLMRLSNTVVVTGLLILTSPLALSILERSFLASLQVSHFVTLTLTERVN